ncbi:hypothetical protein AB1K54_04065 [Microbacterium sp. BWT-B31]|uniref:hypothetical protein n=1 Tax=Microbacterium sp. BWT-B31 TaxID=3232072 RepID=UPI003528487D
MTSLTARSVRPSRLLLSADAQREGWYGMLQTAVRNGHVVKVRPGVYIDEPRWQRMTSVERYLARIHAVGATFSNPVFARQSAAVVHGLPLLNSRLTRIHLHQTTPRGSGRRGDVTVHAGSDDPDIVTRDGLRLTSAVRTVVDLARLLPHGEALALADAAIRPQPVTRGIDGTGAPIASQAEILDALRTSCARRGAWAAYLAISEADAASGSVGESLARSLFCRLGATRPELQTPLWDADGLIGYADFFWREFGVVGEFDGKLKYGADNPSGRAPEEVVYREKLREDRIRRVTSGFVRLGWRDLDDPPRVARLLTGAGVPLSSASAWPQLRPVVRAAAARADSPRVRSSAQNSVRGSRYEPSTQK